MERVQFQQEQMLAELKDLVQKGLFTAAETKQIMKKRTAFETALVRRVSKKSDFIRYAAYEMKLEQLRRKRVKRLQLPPSPPSVSDYALVRRQFHIFERALKKFKSDVGLWVQYVQVAKREGARALVGRITARALQLHPNTPGLYILAASHELSHQSHTAARTLLQRGIRLNADSIEMWREYVKMELGFIESLRSGHEEEEDGGNATRKEIMDGAIVKLVISNAAKSLCKIELFNSLHGLITTYPSPQRLKEAMLDHLLAVLRITLPDDPLALKLSATRDLKPDVEGKDMVEALKGANENFLTVIHNEGKHGEGFLRVYAEFVEEWCRTNIDDNLQLYLVSSLQSLIQRNRESASLSSAHVRLLRYKLNPTTPAAASGKVIKFARKYTSAIPKSAEVWLARLDTEKQLSNREEVELAWSDARRYVEGTSKDVEDVWLWGLEQYSKDRLQDRLSKYERLLQESMRSGCSSVYETLLMNYATLPHVEVDCRQDTAVRVRRIGTEYLATARVWAKVFATEATVGRYKDAEGQQQVLGEIYELWRMKDELEATVAWAKWLLNNGRGKEAGTVVVTGGCRLKEAERQELEKRWAGTLREGEETVDVEELTDFVPYSISE